jgi:ABC-type multidrug transport system ATPase subunit
VAIIEKGRLIYTGPVQGVRDQMASGLVYWVLPQGDPAAAVQLLQGRPEVAEAIPVDGQVKVTFASRQVDPAFLGEALVRGGIKFTGLWEDELGLEEVFLRVTRGETQ